MFTRLVLMLSVLVSCSISPVLAQLSGGGEANPELHTNQKTLKQWQDMRFGMFIHWGPVSLRGTEISWSRGDEVPVKDYDSLYKTFDPVLFDAAKWVRTAKEAGMKYLIITSKHHDGFCLWDSQYTDYDIMSTPYHKDILKALSEECKKQGIKFGIYYSIADWHHPDYPVDQREVKPSYKSASKSEKEQAMARYIPYMKSQLKEIIETYNPGIIWFDGEWESPWTHQMGMDLYAYLRNLKDDLLINNRVDKGRQGLQGMSSSSKYAGDYGTPEQQVGNYNTQTPWESCITIGQQWAWKPNDQLKSLRELKHLLLNTVGGDGNLLLNVGPMLDGRMEDRQVRELKQLGDWLDRYGDAIYGTRGGPYVPTETMVSTRKGHTIYLHLMKHPGKHWELPLPEGVQVEQVRFMRSQQSVDIQTVQGGIQLALPDELPDPDDSIIEMEINKNAENLNTIERERY
ncbi:MAG TPA: alpha-L-fucosidase [Balneolaceae bacterium]|nr:alpha-L-fucosidase [Balneolaceae bacterium]